MDDHRPITGRLRQQLWDVHEAHRITHAQLYWGLKAPPHSRLSLEQAAFDLDRLAEAAVLAAESVRLMLRGAGEEDRAAWLLAYNEAEEAGNVTRLDPSRREAA